MTITITGAVTVDGVRAPLTVEVTLPDTARNSPPVTLRVVPKAS